MSIYLSIYLSKYLDGEDPSVLSGRSNPVRSQPFQLLDAPAFFPALVDDGAEIVAEIGHFCERGGGS